MSGEGARSVVVMQSKKKEKKGEPIDRHVGWMLIENG